MPLFTKPQHETTFKKLLASHQIPTAGKNFEEALIKLLEAQQKDIDALKKQVKLARNKKTLNFGLHQK